MWRRKKEEKIIKKCVDDEKRDKGKIKLKIKNRSEERRVGKECRP